jgi:peptidoglycan L-alanyl-D-glutamate endopeptidase CwlK
MVAERPSEKIYRQIEQSADFYQPAVYELLKFYHALELQDEPLDGQFIPLTTVQPWEQEKVLMFAVGLIPPSTNVTGRLLDRSASIGGLFGDAIVPADEAEAFGIEEVRQFSGPPYGSIVEPSPREQRRSESRINSIHESVQPLARALIEAAAREGISLVVNSGFRSIAEQDRLYAKGRTTKGGIVTGVKGGGSWHNFGLAFDVAMVSPGPKPPKGTRSWPPGKEEWRIIGGIGESLGMKWGGSFSNLWDPGHFEYHPGITKKQALEENKRPAIPNVPLPIGDVAAPTPEWPSVGSSNAREASKTASQLASTTLSGEELGKQFQAQQQAMINQMVAAIDQMAKTPPLRLLVNPRSFRVAAEKLISDGNWGRNGPIIEHWGENQDQIEGSGKIAAFYSLDAYEGNSPGLSRTARQFSASYQNLLSLWLIYKNNGGIYFPDPMVPAGSRAKNLSVVGSVYFYYDGIMYIGSFDNFNLNETDTTPFSLEYTFTFTVRAWFILDHLDDPQYNYGTPQDITQTLPTGSDTPPLSGGNNEQISPEVALPFEVEAARETEAAFGEGGEFDIDIGEI